MSATRTKIILAHADQRIPRYTSYPTAPHFGPDVNDARYRDWLKAVPATASGSLYLHVPFCEAMCWYCGCNTKVTRRVEPVEAYLDTLERELDLLAEALPHRLPLEHIHWGGGSPTLVPAARFSGIMAHIRRVFDVRADAEIAVEIDPRTMRDNFIIAMAEAGVNRASLGVQTFDADVQSAINRVQPYEQVANAMGALRAAGIHGLNADLLYGLPLQSVESVVQTTEQMLTLNPERVSVFGYAHVPHMKVHQRLINEAALPDAAERLAQADAIAAVLEAAGYRSIGLDHFARADDDMVAALDEGQLHRNFQGYTTDQASVLLGVGASAIGSLPQGYVQNNAAAGQWSEAIENGRFATSRGIALSGEDRMRRELIERIMCDLEVNVGAVAAAHGLQMPVANLDVLEAEGIVRHEGERMLVDPDFRPLARVVAAAFDARMAQGGARHSRAV